MESFLHPDIANIDPKNATPEDMERLMSDPLMRSLHYQMTHGVQDIKLETNKGEQKFKNICLPEGADPEEYLQKAMAEDAATTEGSIVLHSHIAQRKALVEQVGPLLEQWHGCDGSIIRVDARTAIAVEIAYGWWNPIQ